MDTGPFGRLLPVYTLDFGTVSVQAHLSKKRDLAAQIAGLQTETKELVAQCHNPKAGSPLIQHGMKATVSPSWDGLEGTFTVTGEPDSDPFAVTRALGRVYYGTFEQSADSVDDGADWEDWTRLRKVRTGTREDTKAPIYETQTATVRLKLTKATGDETTDYEPLTAQVLARAGTLEQGDLVTRDESYVVTATPMQEGEFERAELRMREY